MAKAITIFFGLESYWFYLRLRLTPVFFPALCGFRRVSSFFRFPDLLPQIWAQVAGKMRQLQSQSLRIRMVLNPLCLGILLITADAARVTTQAAVQSVQKQEHPSLQLPSSAEISASVTIDDGVKWTSSGKVSYKSNPWYLTAVSDHQISFKEKQRKSGVQSRHTTFVGWNNLLNRMVTRYLFVTDYDDRGHELSSKCLTYKEEGAKAGKSFDEVA